MSGSSARSSRLTGQFCISESSKRPSEGTHSDSIGRWALTTYGPTPWSRIVRAHQPVGWIVGRIDGSLGGPVEITAGRVRVDDEADEVGAETISQSLLGSFCVVLADAPRPAAATDACGSVPVVFSPTTRRIASTPTALQQDLLSEDWSYSSADLINDNWYPFGLTGRHNVTRLLPNHALDLASFRMHRFWPSGPCPRDGTIDEVIDALRIGMRPAEHSEGDLRVPLTAGKDSRLLFGLALNQGLPISAYTLVSEGASVDRYVAERLCRRTDTPFETYAVQRRSPEEVDDWFYATGSCVGGANVVSKQPDELFSSEFVEISGVGGEIARGFYWRSTDAAEGTLSAEHLVGRLALPAKAAFLDAGSVWLDGLSRFDLLTTLDLAYIELRVGSWAAPQIYGGRKCYRQVSPFLQWPFVRSAGRLPEHIRRDDLLSPMILDTVAPELLELPYGSAPFWVRLADKAARARKPAEWTRMVRKLRSG